VEFSVTTVTPTKVEADLLAVPVFADAKLGPGADAVDTVLEGELATYMADADFSGKPGEVLSVPGVGVLGAGAALLVGVGEPADFDLAGIRSAAASVARRAKKVSSVATTLLDALPDGIEHRAGATALAEGFALGAYQYLRYKSKDEPSALEHVVVIAARRTGLQGALDRGGAIANAVTWARDLVNTPAGDQSPTQFVSEVRRHLRDRKVTVKVLDAKAMEDEGMGGVLGVGQGSSNRPRFMRLTYSPRGAKPGVLALVGKGVVFDSGGLSIKPSSGMETMKTDMSGAAAVVAAMSVLDELSVKHKVVAYAPLVENMPSGTAIRPGDVLEIRNGTTVEVLNTDAEGRLILADALSLAADDGADAIVDVATLTGACMVALGDKIAGLMGNRDDWIDQVRDAADRAGERVWPLPLPSDMRKQLESEVADLKNITNTGYGGALSAGLFLSEFVDDVPWAHIDIAGPARAGGDDGHIVKGGTGFGVMTLVELASRFRKPRKQ
jgi:leucyl aminopeptidase